MRFRYADFSAMGMFFIEYPKLFRSMIGSLLVGKLGDKRALLQAKQEQVLTRCVCQPFALRVLNTPGGMELYTHIADYTNMWMTTKGFMITSECFNHQVGTEAVRLLQ